MARKGKSKEPCPYCGSNLCPLTLSSFLNADKKKNHKSWEKTVK